jgi:hypothetical protein
MPENSYINTHPKTPNPKKKPRVSKSMRNGTWNTLGSRRRRNGVGGMRP